MDDEEYPKARSRSPVGYKSPIESENYFKHVRKL